MTQYLMAVHGNEETYAAIAPEDVQRMYAQTGAFNDELQAAGRWVFGGGLKAVDTATVVNAVSGETVMTDGPYARDQGAPRRVLGDHRRRPRRGPRLGPQGVRRVRSTGRGPSVRGRGLRPECRRSTQPGSLASSATSHGKAIATLVRQFGDIDVAEEAVQEAFVIATRKWPETGTPPNPGALDPRHRPQPSDRPAAPGVLPP